jgi:DNA-directed RNA polymerase specialized sigma24 family protein
MPFLATEGDVRSKIAADLLTANANMQRALADDLRDCIDYARKAGLTWRDIGKALGMNHTAVHRLYRKAGLPIGVVRPFKGPNRRSAELSCGDTE